MVVIGSYSGRNIIFLIFKINELFFISLCYCHYCVACYFPIDFRISFCRCLSFAPVFLHNIVCGLFAHSSVYSEVASHVNDAVFLKCLSVAMQLAAECVTNCSMYGAFMKL